MQPSVPPGYRPWSGNVQSFPVWPAPEPLLGEIERAPYPIDALPPSIRGVVQEITDCVQVPPEMAASSVLAIASLAAQGLADVRRSTTLTGPIGLYFLTVAESGDRKSTGDRLVGRAVYQFQDAQRDASKATLANHTADLAAWQAKHDAKVSAMNNDAKSNKDIIGHQADLAQLETGKPQAPRVPRLIYTDVTQEKLMRALANEWPCGGIFSSEGAAVLGGHSMGKDSVVRTLASLNALWDGAPYHVDRVQGGSFVVCGARLSMHLQVQPHVLTDFMDRDRGLSRGSGFLARLLISQPVSMQGRRKYRDMEATFELDAFSVRIAELLNDVPAVDPEHGLSPALLDFEPEAKAVWVEHYNAIEGQLGTDGDFANIRDVASKAADNIARMAAVLHVFDHGPVGFISAAYVESAARIVLWHLYESRALLGPLALSKDDANAATLDRWLIDRCRVEGVDGFKVGVVQNGGPNVVRRREAFNDAVAILTRHHRARVIATGGKGRMICVNPALLDGTVEALEPADNTAAVAVND